MEDWSRLNLKAVAKRMENPFANSSLAHTFKPSEQPGYSKAVNLWSFCAVYSCLCSREAANLILLVPSIPKYTIYVNSFCQSNQLILNVSARAQGQDCEGELLVSHKYFLQKKDIFLDQYMLGNNGKEIDFQRLFLFWMKIHRIFHFMERCPSC